MVNLGTETVRVDRMTTAKPQDLELTTPVMLFFVPPLDVQLFNDTGICIPRAVRCDLRAQH